MILRALTIAALLLTMLTAIGRAAPDRSLRPEAMPSPRPTLSTMSQPPIAAASLEFTRWLRGFRARAQAQGIRRATLDAALTGLTPDPAVIAKDRNQAEFTQTIWDYLDRAVSDTRVANGRAALAEHRDTLAQITARYGVPAEIVTAVWGMETAYGTFRGNDPVIRALATLAHDARRARFFEAQLIDALAILQAGDTTPAAMTGSWAGAMGHTQFMPSSFRAYAVDFTGDGRRDIWGDDPTDALASTANYLAQHGWTSGQPWGVEVRLPAGFDYGLTGGRITKPTTDWAALGVRDMEGKAVPNHGAASIRIPAGAEGAAFMTFDNFRVISRYNPADAYVLGVGHLSDRIAGGGPIQAAWPREDRALTRDERKELQRRLTEAGFSTRGVDGIIGPNSVSALRAWQSAQGLTPDGYPSLAALSRLR